jgi:hypothetical protein
MKALSDFVLNLLIGSPMARWSPIPLRLIVGYGFMQHGFAKLSRGPDMFGAVLQGMGVPAARHGMVDDTHRTARRPRCTAGGIRDDGQRADDGFIIGGDV